MPLKLITMLREGEQQVDLQQRGNSRDQRSVCKREERGRLSTESLHVPGNAR